MEEVVYQFNSVTSVFTHSLVHNSTETRLLEIPCCVGVAASQTASPSFRTLRSLNLNPKPSTLNPKPSTLNPKPKP